ncbi:MAG TPA: mobile mystery protein A [Acidobacteria bacterium]|nr:mobile mystery protein A [Acidobacteriota bacterium]
MNQSRIARHRLDERLRTIRPEEIPRPHRGWIRAVREALGMSARELGRRMGVTQQSVVDFERSEQRSTIRLDTLERAAAAMGCELVYAIVPRTSLEETVQGRAREMARRLLASVEHHSRLEDQSVSDADLAVQIDEIAADLVDRRGLWRDSE